MDVLPASAGMADDNTVIVVGKMVLLNSILRFWQEFSSNNTADHLKHMVSTTATVVREKEGTIEIDIKAIVPGDIGFFASGDKIPAD